MRQAMSSERLPFKRWLEFRYTRPVSPIDRIFVGVWVGLSIGAAAVASTRGREIWPVPLLFLIFVPVFIAGRRKAFLQIGKKSMRCEIAPGRNTSIAWQTITELRESHFDLGIVHLDNSHYSRVSLPKRFFKEEHWREITGAISERVLSQAPGAIVEIETLAATENLPDPDEERPE